MRKVDVFVKGPGSGRETAIRSLQAAGLEVGHDLRRHAAAAQRLPSAEASPGLRGRGQTDGSLHRCRLPPLPSREDEAVPQGQQVRRAEVPVRARPYPPGQHGRGRTKESEYLLQLREKQKARRSLRRAGEAVPPLLRGGQPPAGQDRREPAADPRVAAGQRRLPGRLRARPGTWPASSSSHGHFLVNGKKVDIPSLPGHASTTSSRSGRSRCETDAVRRSRRRRPATGRSRRGWRSIPSQLQILVHSLPGARRSSTRRSRSS